MNIAVVGGGLSGLASACALVDNDHRVTVFERRPWAGGKTYSFVDRKTGQEVDNGQHVFMACTTAYAGFLEKIGTLGLTRRQHRLSVPVFDGDGRRSTLRASRLPAPLHLAWSFLRYRHIPAMEKPGIARLLFEAARMNEAERLTLHDRTLGEWLRARGQSEAMIRAFWDFMLIPTMNARADECSAADSLFVLREGFLHSNRAAGIGVASCGLSRLQVDPAIAYIEQRGGLVRTGVTVSAIHTVAGQPAGVVVESGAVEAFDGIVCALPPRQAAELLPPGAADLRRSLGQVSMAPIVNLHTWFDRPVAPFAMAAFTGSELQWVFNRDRFEPASERPSGHRLVVSLSAAAPYMELTRKQLRERFVPLLHRAIPGTAAARLLHFVAIKEPEATFVPAPHLRRPGPKTCWPNLVLAGAHTNTGWPATMESAVRSGEAAARTLNDALAAVPVAHAEETR